VVFIAQIYAAGLVALKLDRAILYVSVVAAATSIGVNFVAIPQGGATAAAIVLVISEAVLLVGCFGVERAFLRSRSATG
jgi:O-antigen/teichoic acid export membrane protein